jgi:hypothetical protein
LLGWLLRFLLALLAARFIVRALRRNPAPRPFDPQSPPKRENPRATPPYESAGVEDAEYEELPGR